jgi:hypothetical protein
MATVAGAALFLCGCPGTTTTQVLVREPAAVAVEIESSGVPRELLPARAWTGALPGVAYATRAADGSIEVRCASCFGDDAPHGVAYDGGAIIYEGSARELLTWRPDALRVRLPVDSDRSARVTLVVPKNALATVKDWRIADHDLGYALLYLGSAVALTGSLLGGLAPSSPGTARTALEATGVSLAVLGLAGMVTGLVYVFSPRWENQHYP